MASPISPGFIFNGLRREVLGPMSQSIQDGSRVIKGLRESYPVVDTVAGIYPPIAGLQMANDVTAGQADGGTALNALQAVPLIKKLNAVGLGKGMSAPFNVPGLGKFAYDAKRTLAKNAALTALPVMAGAAEAK